MITFHTYNDVYMYTHVYMRVCGYTYVHLYVDYSFFFFFCLKKTKQNKTEAVKSCPVAAGRGSGRSPDTKGLPEEPLEGSWAGEAPGREALRLGKS